MSRIVVVHRATKDQNHDLMETIGFIHDCLDNASSAWARFQAFTCGTILSVWHGHSTWATPEIYLMQIKQKRNKVGWRSHNKKTERKRERTRAGAVVLKAMDDLVATRSIAIHKPHLGLSTRFFRGHTSHTPTVPCKEHVTTSASHTERAAIT